MVRHVDSRGREEEILDLIIDSYIKESRPISSAYLFKTGNFSCSPATIRNVMVSLERQGLLSHIYTSSGRVPTRKAFKRYAESFNTEDIIDEDIELDFCSLASNDLSRVIDYTLDRLSKISGYTSLIAISGDNGRLFYKGMQYILNQPEFEDIQRLKHLFYALEERVDDMYELLSDYANESIKILIGDDIGLEEISDCSLVISGLKEQRTNFTLALLGPIRMDYSKAASCLQSVNKQLREVVEDCV